MIRTSCTSSTDHDSFFAQMSEYSFANKWFCDFVDLDRRCHSHIDPISFECFSQGNTIDDCCYHTNIVTSSSIHAKFFSCNTTEDITSSQDDNDFDILFVKSDNFFSQNIKILDIKTIRSRSFESFS